MGSVNVRECVVCGKPTPSAHARLCDACRPAHMSGVGSDLYFDRFGHKGRWTKERIIMAIQEWTQKYGEPPRVNDWRTRAKSPATFGEPSRRAWPQAEQVIFAFGSWNAAIETAGFQPRTLRREGNPSRPNGKTCRPGLHPWVPENIYVAPNGDKRCRACLRERQREYQRRKRHGIT